MKKNCLYDILILYIILNPSLKICMREKMKKKNIVSYLVRHASTHVIYNSATNRLNKSVNDLLFLSIIMFIINLQQFVNFLFY